MSDNDFVCVALVDPRGWVLMQERDEHPPFWPDMWCLPGGGLEGEESPVEGALRELVEETGVRLDEGDLTDLGGFEEHRDGRTLRYHCFASATHLGDDEIECHEGRRMVFVDPARWDELDVIPPTRTVLPELTAWIARHRPGATSDQGFAGVILVDREGRVLLQERDEHAPIDPERWGLAGGHLEPGEEPQPAALRELEEETGVRLEAGDLHHVGTFTVDHRPSRGTWDRMDVYAAATDLTDDEIECHEGRRIVFVDPDRARGLDLTAAAAQIVPAFLDSDLCERLAR